ncbi:MAG: hypothetical protein J2P50_00240 [Hyphomicrobiaceae bacterium]|nr:hypothetical protein [Hyphomicrobiaceae bacterium]
MNSTINFIRGVFHWIALTAFWGWNAVMAYLGYVTWAALHETPPEFSHTATARAGYDAGVTFGMFAILLLWALVAGILYMIAASTRRAP